MTARIGVFGIGLAAYWPQFPGMKERLEGYQGVVEERVRGFGGEVVSAGLVDTPEGGARRRASLPARGRGPDSMLRGDLRHVVAGAAGGAEGAGSGVGAESATVRRRSIMKPRIPRSGWRTVRSAACRRLPTPSRAPASISTWSRASFTRTPLRGAKSKTGAAPRPLRAPSASAASAFWAIPIRACWTCIPTSPRCTRSLARTSRYWRWTTWRNGWRPRALRKSPRS